LGGHGKEGKREEEEGNSFYLFPASGADGFGRQEEELWWAAPVLVMVEACAAMQVGGARLQPRKRVGDDRGSRPCKQNWISASAFRFTGGFVLGDFPSGVALHITAGVCSRERATMA